VSIKFFLLNTRSINKKELILTDFTVENGIDIFAVTETWLRHDNTFCAAEVCPKGYYFYHIPRKSSKDGGVGVLLKKSIRIKTQSQRKFILRIYIHVTMECSNSRTRMVIIYRPPSSRANFLKNFATLWSS
jgi:exonuclease III